MRNFLITNNNSNTDLFNFFDETFNGYFKPIFSSAKTENMHTDIIDNEDSYLLNVELAGFNKDDIQISIDNDYLTIEAKKDENTESKDKVNYIKKERSISCSRSFYVGNVVQDDIKATYENGLLSISVPKEKDKDKKQIISIN